MDTLRAIGVRRGLTLLVLALACLLAALTTTPSAKADVDVYLDADDRTQATLDFANTINQLNLQYPETGHVIVTVDPILIYGALAQTQWNVVTLNEDYAENPAELDSIVQDNINQGYFPGGCSGAVMVAIHEFGHVLDNARGNVADDVLVRGVGTGEQLHGYLPGYSFDDYGSINAPEALANAFTAVQCGTANAVEQKLFQILVTS